MRAPVPVCSRPRSAAFASLLALGLCAAPLALAGCGSPDPEAEDEGGDGDTGGDGDGDGLPPPGVGENGNGNTDGNGNPAPDPNENSDADGYCYDPETGFFPCDDGAPPGTGVPGFEGDGDGDGDNGGDGDGNGDGDGDTGGDGDGDTGGDGDGDGDGDNGGGLCAEESFLSQANDKPRILLVVDKSGSMDDDAVGYAGSKWDGAVSALSTVVQSTESEIDYGLMLYPDGNANNNVCREGSLEVSVGPDRATQIVNTLNDNGPGGGTPTASTLAEAMAELQSLGDEGGTRAVVLATDGGPNCNESLNVNTCVCMIDGGCDDPRNCLDDVAAVSSAQALNAAGFAVFVVGIPGSENYTGVLNDLAEAGGTAQAGATNYYQANDSGQLATAIADIVNRVATCRFDLSHVPALSTLEVSIDGNTVPYDATRTNGWDLVDGDTIELFGASCSLAMTGGVDVVANYCYGGNG